MRPLLHPHFVNGRFDDPAVFVETLFERRAILFDVGDISRLTPRSIQRLEHVFVSDTHIDHFFGFDRLLRVLIGREKTLNFYEPQDFIGQVEHKLSAYRWNLVDPYPCDLVIVATGIDGSLATTNAMRRWFRPMAPSRVHAVLDAPIKCDSYRQASAMKPGWKR